MVVNNSEVENEELYRRSMQEATLKHRGERERKCRQWMLKLLWGGLKAILEWRNKRRLLKERKLHLHLRSTESRGQPIGFSLRGKSLVHVQVSSLYS